MASSLEAVRAALPARASDPACALCGGRERRTRFRDGPWSVVTCRECDLTYVTPRLGPAELLARVYDESYWSSPAARERGYGDYLGEEALYLETFRRRWRALRGQLPTRGRALDVGCAAGYFLRVLDAEGWEVAGVEPSPRARAACAEALGPEALRGTTLEQADLEPASFDLVSFWDVLEHLSDPLAALRAARRLLRPEGRLVVETQDVRSLASRLLGRRWQHFKHAEHLVHFHRGTLRRALRSTGFEPLSFRAAPGGKYVSPAFLVERAARLHPALSRWIAPLARRLPEALWIDPRDELVCIAAPSAA